MFGDVTLCVLQPLSPNGASQNETQHLLAAVLAVAVVLQ